MSVGTVDVPAQAHAEERKKVFPHKVHVGRDDKGLWAMNLAGKTEDDRQETWQRVTRPVRDRGNHVQSILEHKAEEDAKKKDRKVFYWDSQHARDWASRMAQPLRAAEKYKGH